LFLAMSFDPIVLVAKKPKVISSGFSSCIDLRFHPA